MHGRSGMSLGFCYSRIKKSIRDSVPLRFEANMTAPGIVPFLQAVSIRSSNEAMLYRCTNICQDVVHIYIVRLLKSYRLSFLYVYTRVKAQNVVLSRYFQAHVN